MKWASDTIIHDLELYSDPRQGVGSWLLGDEAETANELGECLWSVVGADPFSVVEKLAANGLALRPIASRLVQQTESNGHEPRRVCRRLIGLSHAATSSLLMAA